MKEQCGQKSCVGKEQNVFWNLKDSIGFQAIVGDKGVRGS